MEKSKLQQFQVYCARTKYLSNSWTIIAHAQTYFLSKSSWTRNGSVQKLGAMVQVTFYENSGADGFLLDISVQKMPKSLKFTAVKQLIQLLLMRLPLLNFQQYFSTV